MKEAKITPEEKEMLRRLMEDDEACKQWDFFAGMNWEVPPPEVFMAGRPKRIGRQRNRKDWTREFIAGAAGVVRRRRRQGR